MVITIERGATDEERDNFRYNDLLVDQVYKISPDGDVDPSTEFYTIVTGRKIKINQETGKLEL